LSDLVAADAIDFHAINGNSVKMRKNAVAVNKVELCNPAHTSNILLQRQQQEQKLPLLQQK